MRKEYMVLGVKNHPILDDETEKDDPHIFGSLARAFEIAKKEAEESSYARVVKLENIEEINHMR